MAREMRSDCGTNFVSNFIFAIEMEELKRRIYGSRRAKKHSASFFSGIKLNSDVIGISFPERLRNSLRTRKKIIRVRLFRTTTRV